MEAESSSMHVIEIDFCDPAEAAHALRDLPFLTFLDSSVADRKLGRYSFIAVDPFARIIAGVAGEDWVSRLKSRLAAYRTAALPGLPPFQGGAAGLFSYELGRSLERLPAAALDKLADADSIAAEVVKLHYFAGLPIDETAALLQMSERNAFRKWRFARAWLHRTIGAEKRNSTIRA
jgi:anthranilate/para-aminobenzoate synthase component I